MLLCYFHLTSGAMSWEQGAWRAWEKIRGMVLWRERRLGGEGGADTMVCCMKSGGYHVGYCSFSLLMFTLFPRLSADMES